MSRQFEQNLYERKRQVRHYLLVVASAERSAKLGASSAVEQGRLLTLRAGAFLVLYNLVEASMREAIEAIHDEIIAKDVGFPKLVIELRKEAITRFKRDADPSKDHTMNDFPAAFVAVALALDKGIKMSGNVDARTIKEFGKSYGFTCDTDARRTDNGADLVVVKNLRNDLAHGTKMFEEVGRDYTAHALMVMSRKVMTYITQILANISSYLTDENYLEKPPA
jgi:hypothetical protein